MPVSNSTDRFNGVIASLAIKAPCVAVAIANLTLSGEQTVNGVAVVAGDRVLVIGQTEASENGIYDASSSAWARAADWDGNRDVVSGTLATVATATVGRNPLYQVTTANPITIGTTAVNFTLADGPNVSFALVQKEIDDGLTTSDINDSFDVGHLYRYITNTTPGTTDLIAGMNTTVLVATPTSSGVFDSAGGIQAVFPAGVLGFTDEFVVPEWVNLLCAGKGLTVFKCLNAAATIRFGTKSGAFGAAERGGESSGFSIDGNGLSLLGLHIGFVVERGFRDINVFDCPGDGILFEASQNCNLDAVDSQHNGNTSGSGSNIVFDYGAGKNRLYGSEINRPGAYNIKYIQSGTSPSGAHSVPTGNGLIAPMIERWEDQDGGGTLTALGTIYHGAGRENYIDNADLSATGLPSAMSMVKMRKDGSGASNLFFFHNCRFHGTAAWSTVFDLADVVGLNLTGTNFLENHTKVFSVSGTGVAVDINKIIDSSGGTWWTGASGAVEAQTLRRLYTDTYSQHFRSATTEPVLRTYVDGDGYATPRFELRADGLHSWLSDTNLYRGAANRLQSDDQIYAVLGFRTNADAAITAFAGGGQGSAVELTARINEISTVATTGDSVKLRTAVPGLIATIKNNGANAADVFPATGDNLGAGVNTAVSLAAGVKITYESYDSTNWM